MGFTSGDAELTSSLCQALLHGGITSCLKMTSNKSKKKTKKIEALIEEEETSDSEEDEKDITNLPDARALSQIFPLRKLRRYSPDYKMIVTYLKDTHGVTHDKFKMEITAVYSVNTPSCFTDHGNRWLLWHGSRRENWTGILKEGPKIRPSTARHTGSMFGLGFYLADMSSKSANYCKPTEKNNLGMLLLCEVSLGKSRELFFTNTNADKLPAGYHSVMGKGKTSPDLQTPYIMRDGTKVPRGKGRKTGLTSELEYNEYIVYDVTQIRMRFLVEVRFEFRKT